MTGRWRSCLSFLLLAVLDATLVSAEHSFENTAVVRTVELGGALAHVTTTYAVRALEDDSSIYTISLGEREGKRTSYMQARMKGEASLLEVEQFGLNTRTGAYLYAVEFPKSLKANDTANLVVESVQTHAIRPWPEEASQMDDQSLQYEADLFILSPYPTLVQRTKIKSPTPKILKYTEPEGVEAYTLEAPATKSGAALTYGPFSNFPVTAEESFTKSQQQRIAVQYGYDVPVLEVTKLERAAEISHWGANLNIQDNIWLHNAGPRLKGHFSRLDFQTQNYYNRPGPHTLSSMVLQLPAGIHDVYYYDLNGNVSTSHLRTVPSVPKGSVSTQSTTFEFRPRYPVLGGWNFSFTLGWDSPLRDYGGWDHENKRYLVGVPLQTTIPTAVVDEAEIKIILPEGATDIQYWPPYPAIMTNVSTHITYLDTVGRPAISLKYEQLTEKHTGMIYVAYKVPFTAHLRKPFAVATALLALFGVGFAAKRIDIRLQR